MATEEEPAPATNTPAEEKVEQVPQEEKVGDEAPAKVDETQVKVEETRHEEKIGDEAQAKVEEIKQEDTIINEGQGEQPHEAVVTEIKVEQISQEEGVVKTEEGVARTEEDEEKIQTVMDLDGPSIVEDDSAINTSRKRITFMEEEEDYSEAGIFEMLQPAHLEIGGEEFQTAIFNLEGQFPFTSSDGLIPPPPSPVLASEDGSHLELEMELEQEGEATDELSTGTQTTVDGDKKQRKSKAKGGKRAGFKIGFGKDAVSDHGGSAHDENKVITGVRDREKEKQQAECNRYAGFEKFASHFVDKLIDKSINNIENQLMYSQIAEEEVSFSSLRTYVEVFGAFTKWPRIQEFSKVIGEEVIREFMQTWDYEEDWMYCVDFLLEQSDGCSEFYLYEAKWSIPSKPYPIPQATASVYFTIEVSRVKPTYCPVDVTYMFEGSRMVHTPGKIAFQEHWLFSIIDAKLEMYKRIKF